LVAVAAVVIQVCLGAAFTEAYCWRGAVPSPLLIAYVREQTGQ
jgi:hypothetical protein